MTWTRILILVAGCVVACVGQHVGDRVLDADREEFCNQAIEEGRFPSQEVEDFCGGSNLVRDYLASFAGCLSVWYLALVVYGLFTKC